MTDIARERRLLESVGLRMRYREEWGARQDYTSARRVEEPAKAFVLHITVTPDPADNRAAEDAAFRIVESIGQSRFEIGCSYNAMITDSCALAEGQPLTRRGAHTVDNKAVFGRKNASLNYAFRAISLVQNVPDDVTQCQVDNAARWAAAQILSGLARRDAPWYGHRDFAYKDCPGDAGYVRLPEIRTLTNHYVRNGLGKPITPTTPSTPTQEKYEMPYPVIYCKERGPQYWVCTERGPIPMPGGSKAPEFYKNGVRSGQLKPMLDLSEAKVPSKSTLEFDQAYSLCRDLPKIAPGK